MLRARHVCLFMYFALYAYQIVAEEVSELSVVTANGPPHIIEATNGGIDLDITLAILDQMGFSTQTQFMPLTRGKMEVLSKRADVFVPTFFEKDGNGLFVSEAIIDYRPTLFTRTKQGLSIEKVSDLATKKIATFQGASGYFGSEFLSMSLSNHNYREQSSMSILPQLLIKERYDVVLLDYYIFYYFFAESELGDISQVKEHVLFDSVKAHVGFNDKELRDEFNKRLEVYRGSEAYREVIRKYLPHY